MSSLSTRMQNLHLCGEMLLSQITILPSIHFQMLMGTIRALSVGLNKLLTVNPCITVVKMAQEEALMGAHQEGVLQRVHLKYFLIPILKRVLKEMQKLTGTGVLNV